VRGFSTFVAIAGLTVALQSAPASANIIDGADDRGTLAALGPKLGLTAAEIQRIRQVSGHVACFGARPALASGALFLADDLVLTAAHTFFENGTRATKCFFRPQTPGADWMPLLTDAANARFGAVPPKPGSNNDWAIVRLATPVAGATPFPPAATRPRAGDRLIVLTAHPADMESLDPTMPVVRGCTVKRVPVSSGATDFYRSDCDAVGGDSGGMHLARVDGSLVFRAITISTGPWRDPALSGAPYDEKAGSVTTALETDTAILAAARDLLGTR
jgi:hypothetical protein